VWFWSAAWTTLKNCSSISSCTRQTEPSSKICLPVRVIQLQHCQTQTDPSLAQDSLSPRQSDTFKVSLTTCKFHSAHGKPVCVIKLSLCLSLYSRVNTIVGAVKNFIAKTIHLISASSPYRTWLIRKYYACNHH